jgi:hypothetical protein
MIIPKPVRTRTGLHAPMKTGPYIHRHLTQHISPYSLYSPPHGTPVRWWCVVVRSAAVCRRGLRCPHCRPFVEGSRCGFGGRVPWLITGSPCVFGAVQWGNEVSRFVGLVGGVVVSLVVVCRGGVWVWASWVRWLFVVANSVALCRGDFAVSWASGPVAICRREIGGVCRGGLRCSLSSVRCIVPAHQHLDMHHARQTHSYRNKALTFETRQ